MRGPQLRCVYDLHMETMSPVSVVMVKAYLKPHVDMATVHTIENSDIPSILDYNANFIN